MDSKKVLAPYLPYDPLEENGFGPSEDPLGELVIPVETLINAKIEQSSRFKNLLLVVLGFSALAVGFAIMFVVAIYLDAIDTAASRREMAILRQMVEAAMQQAAEPYYIAVQVQQADEGEQYYDEPVAPHVSLFDEAMREINPDYVAWLSIGGTVIDYPVVRGPDNEKYLNLSFFGETNSHGTLFMDYRNIGEHVPHIIIYGHNTRTGDKFGELRNFLDPIFFASNNTITLMANDRIVEFEIFAARRTNVHDYAYFLDFNEPGAFHAFLERTGAPPNAVQVITLSTCVSRGNDDERMIVQGALVKLPTYEDTGTIAE